MNNTEIIRNIADENATNKRIADVANCIIGAKGKVCRITMMPQPSDLEKRNGKQRVFITNPAMRYSEYAARKFNGGVVSRLTERVKAMLETKHRNGMVNVCECVRGAKGRFGFQCRTLDLSKVAEIRYGKNVHTFA